MLEIQPQKLQLKNFILWTSIIILIFILGIYWLNKKVSGLSYSIQNQQNQIQALKNREESTIRLQEGYYSIKDKISSVTAVLPDEENVAFFIKYLEATAKKHGTNLELVFDEKTNLQVEANKFLSIGLNISGGGVAVQNTWQSLERGPYFINVTDFNLNTVDGLGSDSQLKLTAQVFTNDPYKISR